MTPATPTKQPTPIPAAMWNELSHLDERISVQIAAALAEHKTEILRIGQNYGFTEAELRDRGILIMTSLGTVAGQAANRGQ